MGRTTRWLALAAAGALAPGLAAAQAAFELDVIDLAGAAGALTHAQASANKLLEPLGARLATRLVAPDALGETPRPRAILLAATAPASASSGLLLAVARPDPQPATIWIYLPSVLRAAGLPSVPEALDGRQRRELGIALGRILLHEILHLLSPGRPHAAAGLMAARLDRALLVESSPQLDAGSKELLVGAGGRLGALVAAAAARPPASRDVGEDAIDVGRPAGRP